MSTEETIQFKNYNTITVRELQRRHFRIYHNHGYHPTEWRVKILNSKLPMCVIMADSEFIDIDFLEDLPVGMELSIAWGIGR